MGNWLDKTGLTQVKNLLSTKFGTKVDKYTSQPGGKFLQTDNNGNAVWGDAASPTAVAAATEDWLDEHVSGGSTIAIDNTLTVSGAAGDAKAIGDLITVSDSSSGLGDTNKLWINDAAPTEVEVPTMGEFNDLKSALQHKNANSHLINVCGSETYEGTYKGVTIKKNGDIISLNGNSSGTTRIKISGNIDIYNESKEAWWQESLGLIAGKKYYLSVTFLGGSIDASYMEFVQVKTDGTNIRLKRMQPTYVVRNKTMLLDPVIVDATNQSCLMLAYGSSNEFTNFVFQVDYVCVDDIKDDVGVSLITDLWDSPLKYSVFQRGYLVNGAVRDVSYRIVSTNIIHADRDILVRIAEGKRVGIHTYNNTGTFVADSGWLTGNYVIKKGTRFRICISGTPNNTYENQTQADIEDFLSYVKFDHIHDVVTYKYQEQANNANIIRKLINAKEELYLGDVYPYDLWMLGGMMVDGVVTHDDHHYRIITEDIQYNYTPLNLRIEDGRRLAVHYFDSQGTFIEDSGWHSGNYTLPANSYFRLMISATATSSSEETEIDADIDTFLKYVHINRKNEQTAAYPYSKTVELTTILEASQSKRMQGGVINGDYLYYAQTDNSVATIHKYDLVNQTEVLYADGSYGHAGDMTFDTKRNLVVVLHGGTSETTLWFLNPTTLALVETKTISTSGRRIGGIAYEANSDCYVVEFSANSTWKNYSFAICDSNYNILYEFAPVKNGYTMQGIECDDKYIYALYYNPNIVVVYDFYGNYQGCHNISINNEPEFVTKHGDNDLCIGSDGDCTIRKAKRKFEWEQ